MKKLVSEKDQVSTYPVRGIFPSMIRGSRVRTTEEQDLFNAIIKSMIEVGKEARDK